MAHIEIRHSPVTGHYRTVLIADNGEPLMNSEALNSKAAADTNVAAVAKAFGRTPVDIEVLSVERP